MFYTHLARAETWGREFCAPSIMMMYYHLPPTYNGRLLSHTVIQSINQSINISFIQKGALQRHQNILTAIYDQD